jgi:hypothetical protein
MAFAYRLQLEDGTPPTRPTFQTAVPNWRPGHVIPFGHRSLRVVQVRDDEADQAPVLAFRRLRDRSAGERRTRAAQKTAS